MQLHKRDVVAAAATILDNYGIADLTMRRLARELGISPGALYWHFANKQQLLGAVADWVLQPVHDRARHVDDADWRGQISTMCSRMRDALLSHSDGAELVSASFASGESGGVAGILGALADAAGRAGLDGERAALAARTLVHYVLGATADEQSRLQWDAAGALQDGSPASPFAGAGSPDPGAGFRFGLRMLIDGLAAQATAGSAAVSAPPFGDEHRAGLGNPLRRKTAPQLPVSRSARR